MQTPDLDTELLHDSLWNMGYLSPASDPPEPCEPPLPTSPTGSLKCSEEEGSRETTTGANLFSENDDKSTVIPMDCDNNDVPENDGDESYNNSTIVDSPIQIQGACLTPSENTFISSPMKEDSCGFLVPPSRDAVLASCEVFDIPAARYTPAHCSSKADVPEKAPEMGGKLIQLEHRDNLQEFGESLFAAARKDIVGRMLGGEGPVGKVSMEGLASHERVTVQTVNRPPSRKQVQMWCKARNILAEEGRKLQSQEDLNLSQKVRVRVRRDSEDSLGSELSCSPPSSPENTPRKHELSVESSPILAGSDCNVKEDLDFTRILDVSPNNVELTPILRKRESEGGKPGKMAKRRISWDVSQELQNTKVEASVDEVESHQSNDTTLRRNLLDSQFQRKFLTPKTSRGSRTQIDGMSPEATRPLPDLGQVAGAIQCQYLTLLNVELHVNTRQDLLPDPEFDAIVAVFYRVVRELPDDRADERDVTGLIALSPHGKKLVENAGVTNLTVRYVQDEMKLIANVVKLVRDCDADILSGYEVQMSSWGYIFQRAATLGVNIGPPLSRIPGSVNESRLNNDDNPGAQYAADTTSDINIVGRVVFNIWRLMRSEVALYTYTLENVCKAVLGQRRPCFSHRTLTEWWSRDRTRGLALEYILGRLGAGVDLLAKLDLVSRTSELARLFGIQLVEVMTRGSQFRVESSMLRLAKPSNYVAVSPTRPQLAAQAAPEYLALLLEPESRFYTDPVVVLDFMSLYPTVMIAHNYCYSTCLGRVQHLGNPGPYEFGCTQLRVSPERLEALKDYVTISPGGVVFLKRSVRRGILPQMLEDILNTRIMVKKSMKIHGKDAQLQKVLHARQLGLKLIANVTYGYTSANFSGRMPCIEVGDSVVAKGREALERCIKTVESNPKWGAKVVYGDTDSVFVLLKGKTKDQAFDIGEEMAKVVTEENPKPMKLKFEKVYLPCILQTKKRYVGYMYETKDQAKPVYDAKGIETVRRDGIPATVKMLEKSIRILFETKDVSKVKSYVQEQFRKIVSGTASLQDLTFAKEFRGLAGYRPTACVPALELTRQAMRVDRRAVPRTGERVPYVVVYGEPGLPLIQLVRNPLDLVENPHLRPNAQYYITKVIVNPLNRCLLLVGADALSWFAELPRLQRLAMNVGPAAKQGVISQYFAARRCAACGETSVKALCPVCVASPARAACLLTERVSTLEKNAEFIGRLCVACCGAAGRDCRSLECPVMYKRKGAELGLQGVWQLTELLDKL